MMGEPSIDTLHDPYEDQLSAARFKAERDAAVQELQGLRERNRELWMDCGMEHELTRCAEDKAERLGKLVWRLQNRLAKAHRRERNLRKGMRMWRERAISGPVRTVSAYDLLPEDDLETLRWVREQGGLDALKAYTDCFGNLLRECHGYRDLARDYEKRIMPEGYEWPRYESGEPLRYKDRYVYDGREREVWHVDFDSYGEPTILNKDGTRCHPDKGERVERPAVLTADGEPPEAGQTVYHTDTGREYQIHSISDDGKGAFVYNNSLGQDAAGLHLCPVGKLTHTKPEIDSWGRIEDDCTMPERDYYAKLVGHDVGLKDDAEIHEAVSRDLVRRAKKLAEKENGNE